VGKQFRFRHGERATAHSFRVRKSPSFAATGGRSGTLGNPFDFNGGSIHGGNELLQFNGPDNASINLASGGTRNAQNRYHSGPNPLNVRRVCVRVYASRWQPGLPTGGMAFGKLLVITPAPPPSLQAGPDDHQ